MGCELKEGDISIRLQNEKEACEFPEGNKVDCAFFTVTNKELTRKSSVVFRKGADWKAFCLSLKEGEATRELSPFKEASIKLDCASKGEEMLFSLKIDQKETTCKLSL